MEDKDKVTEALNELKNRMKGVMDPDLFEDENIFRRFLKARNYNVDLSEKMLRDHLEFRKKYDFKNIMNAKHPEVFEKYLPIMKLGYDKEGNVVHYIPAGNIDWIGLRMSCKLEDFTKFMAQMFEQDLLDMKERSEKLGKTLDKVVFIQNSKNFPFAQATDKKVIYNTICLINDWQNNFPETLKSLIIIEASFYFGLLFSLVKKFVPAEVLKKIVIYSDDSWKEDLLKTIDADVLPAFLGGTRTDPDGNPMCLTFINHGEPVPEKYYIHKSKRSLANEPGIEKIIIPRASFHEVELEVKEQDSYLEWEFEIKCRDTGFGLFYQDDEGNKTELVPIQRISTDENNESGLYKCENVGTYIVVFDNTYSLIRSKIIFYKIKVLSPKEADSDRVNGHNKITEKV